MSPVNSFWPQRRCRLVPLLGSECRVRSQCGSVLPLIALLVVAVGGLCLGLGRLGGDAVEAAQARTAADAAALAGAAEGESAAREVAAANAAELVSYLAEGAEVQVRTRVGGAEAVARATRAGPAAGDVRGASGWGPEEP